jgi:uncharacterized damage-inducible protein DinB
MDALFIFQELIQHMAWADAVVFSAILGKPQVEQDEPILQRLRHLHLTQKVFLDVCQDKAINPQETDTLGVAELAEFTQAVHQALQQFLDSLAPDDLNRVVALPWARLVSQNLGFEIAQPTLGQTLLQVTAHSSYHRGQVNARLRELGLEPPMTDFLAWVWVRKPAPAWPCPSPGTGPGWSP